MSERLFHAVSAADWSRHLAAGDAVWAPPSLAGEGFLHLSSAVQLAETLLVHFAGAGPLLLLELDPTRVGADLRWEESRRSQRFPHLYRALEARDALRVWHLAGPRAAPRLGTGPADDEPIGAPTGGCWPPASG